MPRKKKPTYVYLVLNYEQRVDGVYSSLALAAEQYKTTLEEGLSQEDREFLLQEFGENFHDEMEYPACIVVYQLDGYQVWSYDTMTEVRNALEQGEDFTLYEE